MASEIFIPIVRRAQMERLLSVWESEEQPLALLRELHISEVGALSNTPLAHLLYFLVFVFVAVKSPEDLHAPSGHGGEKAGAEVPRRVDWIAAVQTHGDGDGHDDQADAQGLHALRSANVPPVGDGQDAQDERAGADHLGKEIRMKSVC